MFFTERKKRLAKIAKQLKRDWIPDITEYMEVEREVAAAQLDNFVTDIEIMTRYQ